MNIVILAAGMGKRMHSSLPKVLHQLAGKSMLEHVITTARALKPEKLVVVCGHGGEIVRQKVTAPDLVYVTQQPQLGTGHAVMQAVPELDETVPTLVLYGDVPLIGAASLTRLAAAAGNDKLGILTVEMDDPTGYGRIIREQGKIRRIVEQKDGNAEELAVHEINTGIMVIPTVPLKRWLSALTNDNAQGEYYLTDIVAKAVSENIDIVSVQPDSFRETLGVNSKSQLAALERIYQQNTAAALLESGVGLADPARIDVRGSLRCGRDVFIDVNCIFEGDVVLADGVTVGANLCDPKLSGRRRGGNPSVLSYGWRNGRCRITDRSLCPFASGGRSGGRGAYRQLRRGQEQPYRSAKQGQSSGLCR